MGRMLDLGCNERRRGHCAGDEAQPIDAVRMSESTRASPLVPPALRAASFVVCGGLRAAGVRGAASCVGCGELRAAGVRRGQRRGSDSRAFTRRTPIPAQDAGPEGRVARGAKPSCSLTRRPALSVERGMHDEMEEA